MPVGIAKVTQAFGESYNNKTHLWGTFKLIFSKELDDLQQVHQRDFQ